LAFSKQPIALDREINRAANLSERGYRAGRGVNRQRSTARKIANGDSAQIATPVILRALTPALTASAHLS
jgi:hypothetical protein